MIGDTDNSQGFPNAPVVEVAVTVAFEPPARTEPWDWMRAEQFLRTCVADGHRMERRGKYTTFWGGVGAELELRQPHTNDGPDRLRIWSPSDSYCLQIEPDRLLLNCVRTGGEQPRYRHTVEPLLLSILERYLGTFSETKFSGVSLRYTDDVELHGLPYDKVLALRLDTPATMGTVSDFRLSLTLSGEPFAISLDVRKLRIRDEVIRMIWRAAPALPDDERTLSGVMSQRRVCRDVLYHHFVGTFTEHGLALLAGVR